METKPKTKRSRFVVDLSKDDITALREIAAQFDYFSPKTKEPSVSQFLRAIARKRITLSR